MDIRDDDVTLLVRAIHAIRRSQARLKACPEHEPIVEDLDRAAWDAGAVLDRMLLSLQRLAPLRSALPCLDALHAATRALKRHYPTDAITIRPPPDGQLTGDADRIARMLVWAVQSVAIGAPSRLSLQIRDAPPAAWMLLMDVSGDVVRPEPDRARWDEVVQL